MYCSRLFFSSIWPRLGVPQSWDLGGCYINLYWLIEVLMHWKSMILPYMYIELNTVIRCMEKEQHFPPESESKEFWDISELGSMGNIVHCLILRWHLRILSFIFMISTMQVVRLICLGCSYTQVLHLLRFTRRLRTILCVSLFCSIYKAALRFLVLLADFENLTIFFKLAVKVSNNNILINISSQPADTHS